MIATMRVGADLAFPMHYTLDFQFQDHNGKEKDIARELEDGQKNDEDDVS